MDSAWKCCPFARKTTLWDRTVAETNGFLYFSDAHLGPLAGASGGHNVLMDLQNGFLTAAKWLQMTHFGTISGWAAKWLTLPLYDLCKLNIAARYFPAISPILWLQ